MYYFDVPGRGELARLILNYAGIPFEDFRFKEEEWPTIKPSDWCLRLDYVISSIQYICMESILFLDMPFGQVPVLEVDGKLLAQSHTISRFLARRYGLGGKSQWEQSLADMYVDCIYDLQGGNHNYFPVY